ncbi:MAG: hypothetical protein ACFE0S_16245 [Rhodospirillales bacterium]
MVRFVSDEVLKFWDYGCWLRRGASVPAFADYDLMDIHDLSRNVIILDVEEPGRRFKNRFVGTGVVQLFGETTGRYMDEVDLGQYKDRLLEIYDFSVSTGMPYWSLAQVVVHERVGGLVDYPLSFSYERLVYPLADADGAIRHLTAVLVSQPVEAAAEGISYHQMPWPE